MADIKTVENDGDVEGFLASVANETRRNDARTLIDLMQRVTGQPPRMWGPAIIGFGSYHYRYASGREGEMCAAGFSPRKAATTVYFVDGVAEHADDLAELGPHTTSVSCVYLKRVGDIDLGVLERMVRRSYATVTSGTFSVRLS